MDLIYFADLGLVDDINYVHLSFEFDPKKCSNFFYTNCFYYFTIASCRVFM